MRYLRLVPLTLGWLILGISVLFFMVASGLGYLGEQIMQLAFTEAST